MKALKNKVEIVVYENKAGIVSNGELRRFNRLCKMLESENISIKRYSFEDDQEQLRQNADLWTMVCCAGRETLPATYVNGRIEKIEKYPTKGEVNGWLSGAK
ncbi:MAG: Arsenical resistance operon trans-acting repressor ArsD [Pelotomaculum sp. PtaU1.Bin065]|jgi:hypothetical protein|nr:MAG: Arsenical resistance operon trans-acting repressor ArsD [Pelotomaculum sp. PtaU1.Bin065]